MTSCMQVELPQKPTDILRPFGGMSQMAHCAGKGERGERVSVEVNGGTRGGRGEGGLEANTRGSWEAKG